MDLSIFRLDDKPGTLQGVVVIFSTEVPEVWRRLNTDAGAGQITHAVAPGEAYPLIVELRALGVGERVTGPRLLRELFDDGAISGGYQTTFVGRKRSATARSEAALRGCVEDCYRQQH